MGWSPCANAEKLIPNLNGWAHTRCDPEILMAPALNWRAFLMHKKNLLEHPERSELEQGEEETVLNRSV